jgi:hypothetical protein
LQPSRSRRQPPVFHFFDPRQANLIDFVMQGLWNETHTDPLGRTCYLRAPHSRPG